MPKRSKAQVEKTSWGLQYVLPGAERKISAAKERPVYPVEGDQFVIPGAEPITTRELLRRKLAAPIKPRCGQKGIPLNAQSDLISLSLKIALPEDHDKRRASEWGSALRYLYGNGCKPMAVPAALRENGGTRNCANALKGRTTGKDAATSKIDEQEVWKLIKEHGKGFEVASNRVEMPVGRGVLIAGRNKEGNRLSVRHLIKVDEKLGRDFLQKVANDLTRKSAKAK